MTDDEMTAAIAAMPGDKVTLNQIQARIADIDYMRLNLTKTICSVTLDNGFSVLGESACVAPENYNQEVGEKLAYERAISALWPLFGFLLAEVRFRNAPKSAENTSPAAG